MSKKQFMCIVGNYMIGVQVRISRFDWQSALNWALIIYFNKWKQGVRFIIYCKVLDF